MAKLFLSFAALNGLLAVVLGAFGSHVLKASLSGKLLSAWLTSVQYHFYHVLALSLVGLLIMRGVRGRFIVFSGVFYGLGIVLFCGSLYVMALSGYRWLGPVTPIGGICFMLGWVCLLLAVLSHPFGE